MVVSVKTLRRPGIEPGSRKAAMLTTMPPTHLQYKPGKNNILNILFLLYKEKIALHTYGHVGDFV